VDLRRAELEGRAAELQKLEPQRPRWEWAADKIEPEPEQQERKKESTEKSA
jgi:hypothetical protein